MAGELIYTASRPNAAGIGKIKFKYFSRPTH